MTADHRLEEFNILLIAEASWEIVPKSIGSWKEAVFVELPSYQGTTDGMMVIRPEYIV